jgi:hypothetical protein
MKRIASIFAALVAVASLATPCGAFAADFATCVTNQNVTLTADMLEGGDALFVYTYQEGFTYTFTANSQIKAWILAVGGGGAGGYSQTTANLKKTYGAGGGGGGGGFVETNSISLAAGTYTIEVGSGGAAPKSGKNGDDGGQSSFVGVSANIIAYGGGGGAASGSAGSNGASGGGGSFSNGTGGTAIAEQGNAGGSGNNKGAGAGGGGAGGAGGSVNSDYHAGNGGLGKESSITGDAVVYAAGGGGGSNDYPGLGGAGDGTGNGAGAQKAEAGAENRGGGGGGGDGKSRPGASGGSGIVIIRVTKIYGEITPPVAKDLPYNGEDQTIWVLDDECELSADSDSLTQKEVGEYKFTVTPKDGSCWKDSGGSDAPITITWHITKATPVVTVIQDGWIEGSPVATSYDCSIAGAVPTILYSDAQDGSYTETVPAAAGTYWVKAAIEGTDNYYGVETTPQPFRILGEAQSPNENLGFYAPLTFPAYIGSGNALLTFTLSGFQYVTKDNETSGLCVCAADGTPYPQTVVWSSTGTATVTVEVEAMRSDKVLYLCWGVVEGCSAPTLTPSSMTDAISLSPTHGTRVRDTSKTLHNYVDGLSMPSWRKGETASTPSYAYKIGTPVESYKDKDGNDVADPDEPGTYTLTVTVPEETGTDGFGPYVGASAQTTFKILGETESPLTDGSLKYFAPLTVNSAVEAGRLTVTVPATHDWVAAYNDGKDVRFYDIDGNQYPSALANWVGDGSATFTVQVPALAAGSRFYMCWGETVGKTAPSAGTPSGSPVTVTVTVGATATDDSLTLNNWISGLEMSGFRLNVDTPVEPTCTRKIGTVRYEYSKFQTTGFTEYNPSELSAGSYYMHAVVDASETEGYAGATSDVVPFRVLAEKESPLDSLAYFTPITATGTLTGKIKVAVTLPSTLDYRTIADSGNYIRFCNSDGKILPSRLVTAWATDGTAKFDVELSKSGSSLVFYACWGRVVGQTVLSTSAPTAAAGTATIGFGTTVRDAKKWPLVNHWVKEFAISTTSWAKGDVAKGLVTYTAGDPAYGEFKLLCRNIATDEESIVDSLPDDSGDYELIAFADDGSDGDLVWAALTNTSVEVSITEHNPTISVTHEHGAEGRVLLMNTDLTPGAEIYNQGYADNDPSYSTFWEHKDPETPKVAQVRNRNVSNETASILWTANKGKRLWTLQNCRHGNLFSNRATTGLTPNLCYLSLGSDWARDIGEHDSTTHTRNGAGHILMRNTTNACVYSSCFTEGIGTIYFDAVNGSKDHGNGTTEMFQLRVSIATNCVTSLGEVVDVAPTDEYVFPEEELADDAIVTNANWQPWSAMPVRIIGGAIDDKLPKTETITLDIESGGSTNNFYRIVADIDILTPVRFKIERITTTTDDDNDALASFLLLDNIIVSYPAMRASITTYGADDYDSSRIGKRVIGVPMALSEAFPSVSSTDVRARGTVSYLTNSGVENPQTNDFIVSARFNYRWRHLNQSFYHDGVFSSTDDGRFASVRLSPKDGYLSTKPLDLPGLPGDIEYWYELVLGAPYYRYVDYSGLGLADEMDEIYTEEIATSPIHAPAGFFGETPSPSGGTNWFVRVREGASQYDRVVLSVDDRTGGTLRREEIPMDLIGDHQWRGFVTVTNKTERNLSFYITGVNPQTDGDTEFDSSGERNVEFRAMIPLVDITAGPYSGTMGAVGQSDVPSRDDSGRLHYLTNVASYVEFQFNDSTRALSVSHADYQDFNEWFSSRWENDASLKFYSSAHETNSTTVATKRYPAKAADGSAPSVIEGFEVTPRTKAAWSEDFQISAAQTLAGYPMNIPFPNGSARTPKGWLAEDGMWVAQKWGMTNSTDFALQMEGRGDGSVTFNLADLPNGLDTISFNARLAQFSEFSDIATSWENFMGRNYTIAAQACFDEDSKFSNFSGEASVSLFTGYVPSTCAYEYRITIYNVDASWKEGNNTVNRACCRHAIYKWYVENGAYVAKPLVEFLGTFGEKDSWWWDANNKTRSDMVKELPLGKNGTQYSGMYMSFSNEANRVIITAGVSAGSGNKANGDNKFTYQDKDFIQIGCIDTNPSKTFGSFGVLMKNCPGRVLYPRVYEGKTVAIPTDATDAGGGKRWKGKVALLTDTTSFEPQRAHFDYWGLTPGRVQKTDVNAIWGLEACTNSTQTVRVSTMPVGSTDNWTELTNVTVSAFSDSLEHTISLQSREQRYVRFSSGGTADDVRTDIVIDNITMTQWCGQSGSVTNASTSYGYADDFYYMGAWISNRVEKSGNKNVTKKVAVLAPRRAEKATSPVGIRSPYIEGFGALAFEFADAGADAAIQVQRWTGSLSYLYARNTDAANADGWEPVTNYTFTAGESGTRTVYTGIRAPSNGVFRIVIPQNKVAEAVAHPEYDPNWAAVTIRNIWCYDEPAFDAHSWWGWNFLTTGWRDGVGNKYAALDDSVEGAVGVLNNTIVKESLVTGDADDYKLNSPFIQSPTFGDRHVGEISFRARAYYPGTPSYVTVWGAKSGDLQKAGSWKAVTNIVVDSRGYVRHTVKCADEDGFAAIRLGVSGVTGIEEEYAMKGADLAVLPATAVRAIVDEIVLRERVKPEVGFRLGYVRPFRNGLENRTAVPDIASRDQQPLLGEQFGFQAEVEVTGLADEVDLGHTPEVYLSIYPKSEPWGYANWKDAAGAILDIRLEPADETNLVFRSMSTTPSSFTGPYEADLNLGYGIVQYYLTLKYWDKGGDAHTTSIDSKQWQIPSWYQGFEDPNAATDAKFSPFTVLDSVSPGRAWFNEINFSDENGSGANQFVEVCFPAGHDMTGWRIYRYDVWGKQNLLASLGLTTGVPATKDATGGDPNFAFLALTDSSLPVAGADAYWNRDISSCDGLGSSYGFQLVRPSGIIEHQVVVEGNLGSSPWGKNKAGTNVVAQLEERVGGTWSFVGVDTNAAIKSTGVFRNAGVSPEDWNDVMDMTPGMMNCPGQIPQDWFLPPSGTNVWLTLSTTGGLVWIFDGEELATSKTLIVPFNTETNLVFETAPWHQLGSLVRDATNDVAAAAVRSAGIGGTNVWTYAFKETARNSATLQATAAPDADVLVRGELDPADPYTPAVMNWLLGGTANGEPFEGTEISTNCFFYDGLTTSAKRSYLSLKERYWFDIDPTSDAWDVLGGFGEFFGTTAPVAGEVRRHPDVTGFWPAPVTNRVYTFSMMITNRNVAAKTRPPNRLQGLGGEKSDVVGARNWTSETFKVTMSLIKRPEDISEDSQDVSLRYMPIAAFVFDGGSFGAPDGPNPYAARIEVMDPMSSGSPAYTYNWWLYPNSTYGYSWDLKHGMFLKAPDMLKSTNTWDRTWEAHNDY